MLMHFPVDPVMSVVRSVRVGSHRSECHFFYVGVQTVIHVPCQDNEQPVNCEEPVGARCAAVKLEPTWTSTFLREQQEADFDLKVIIGWTEAGKEKQNHCGKMCRIRVLL